MLITLPFLKRILPLVAGFAPLAAQTPVGNPAEFSIKDQPYQRAEACLPCHQRQYDELRSSVKSGYRAVSPLFNGLELAGNFLNGGLLRPVYKDSTRTTPANTPLNSNLVSSPTFTDITQVAAGFCIGCHNAHVILLGDDPATREIPELPGVGAEFRPDLVRPLRDYHFVDATGRQILPDKIGGPPPSGAQPSLGAGGITCDVCHNVTGPDLDRSAQRDGLANASFELRPSLSKVGPFPFAAPVKDNFHVSSRDPERIAYLRSSTFCGGCHDVRVPGGGSLTHGEINLNPGSENVRLYRLENLNTEWASGPYNSSDNPFGKVIRCQDCHMSLYPYGGESTYQVGDLTITSPMPGVFPVNFAAEPGVSTDLDYPLQKRQVATHYLTGVDVPLLPTGELRARLGADYQDVNEPGSDEYGIPRSLAQRREDLLKSAVRLSLDKTDPTAQIGESFMVRVRAVALTGHRFPSGFSQERTAYIELNVKDNNGFLLYQSGYVVDKPHPETGEMEPDGNLDDEDLEHVHAIVDPGRRTVPYRPGTATNGHTNQVFEVGPDNGPEARVFVGEPLGLVLWRNELARIFLPGQRLGRKDDAGNEVIVSRPHFEETFSAGFANSVDNYRALAPLRPTTYRYEVKLPKKKELELLGVELESPLRVHAQVNFLHFPPLFLQFLARTTGPDGPAGHDMNLIDEKLIDDLLVNVKNIASSDTTVDLVK